jgi:hypothetical protein
LARRRTSARSQALKRAQEAKAQRDAERALRERQIEIALADYYEATTQAERLRADARRKAEAITGDAEHAAAAPLAAAREAVRRLRELLGGNAEVAALCGLTLAAVRELLAAEPGPGEQGAAGDGR